MIQGGEIGFLGFFFGSNEWMDGRTDVRAGLMVGHTWSSEHGVVGDGGHGCQPFGVIIKLDPRFFDETRPEGPVQR